MSFQLKNKAINLLQTSIGTTSHDTKRQVEHAEKIKEAMKKEAEERRRR